MSSITNAPRLEDSLAGAVSEAYWCVRSGPGASDTVPDEAVPPAAPPALDGLSIRQAYRVQHLSVDRISRRWGADRIGFKISCTGVADRKLIGASEPAYGILTDAHLLDSDARIDLSGANSPLVEPELLLRLTKNPGPDSTMDELADSVEVAAGLEIPVSRFRDWWPAGSVPNLGLTGLISDNSVAGFVVAGPGWVRLSATEIGDIDVALRTPDGEVHRGNAAHAYGSPLCALAWLIGITRRHEVELPVGSVIASGTFTVPVRAAPGIYVASYTGVGEVKVIFEQNSLEEEPKHHGA